MSIHLQGTGAAYFRVSTDRQELQRQLDSVAAFEQRHGVTISRQHRYEDHGFARDDSANRPDFQRLLGGVRAGTLGWVVVDHIDRFGFADQWELVELISALRKAGCRLYDTRDDEWTSADLMSFFKAGLAGHSSHDEQVKKSLRSLGGQIARARSGEKQGGPPKLGFDVGVFDRATGNELWRIIYEGRDRVGTVKRKGKDRPAYHIRRRKVYPDGKTEPLNGNAVLRTNKDTQLIRLVPTRDPARLAAARSVFQRYATESISFAGLAKWLNTLKIRNSFGKLFQSRDIAKMLGDETYLGYPTFARRRRGRFHRVAGGQVAELDPELKGRDTASNPEDVVKSATRLYEPLVDAKTWGQVQKKLAGRDRVTKAPRNPNMYLAGLVYCSDCGMPMVARAERGEYECGTWDKARVRGALASCPCLRNGVKHAVLEGYVNRYLEETGDKLAELKRHAGHRDVTGKLTGKLREEQHAGFEEFSEWADRLTDYLMKNHPEEYARIAEDWHQEMESAAEGTPLAPGELRARNPELAAQLDAACKATARLNPKELRQRYGPEWSLPEFLAACVHTYRGLFDRTRVEAELAKLQADLDRLVDGWKDLPNRRAKDAAKTRLDALDARMKELEHQREDAAEQVVKFWSQVEDLTDAIVQARQTMRDDDSPQALRRKAEAVRAVICRIDCEFVLTGRTVTSPGKARSRVSAVTLLPVTGEPRRVAVDDLGTGNGCSEGHGGYRSSSSA
jgi:DNA invertase Pin-like site-specific DNA recombinase